MSEPANDLLKNQPTVVSVPRKKDKPKKPPAIQALIDSSPQIMCELSELFVNTAKDLNSRAKIRAMMKAILDFNSVDTSYPAVGGGGDTKKSRYDPLYGDAEDSAPAVGGVRPIPGSENII